MRRGDGSSPEAGFRSPEPERTRTGEKRLRSLPERVRPARSAPSAFSVVNSARPELRAGAALHQPRAWPSAWRSIALLISHNT